MMSLLRHYCVCVKFVTKRTYPPADSFVSLVNESTSVETLWFRSECPAWVKQTWSSLILVQRSIVRTIVDSFWKRVCCLISKQDIANTNGHINRMVPRCTQHVIPQISWRKKRLISSSLTFGPHSPNLNPVGYAVWWALQQRVYLYHGRKFNTVEELKRAITKEWKNCRNVLLTIALMSGVVVLKVLLRITVDTSNNVISLK